MSIQYVPVLVLLNVCCVRCGKRIVLKIRISHTLQGSNGDKEVTGDRQCDCLSAVLLPISGVNAHQRCYCLSAVLPSQPSTHKIRNIENKGTRKTKMGRDPPPPHTPFPLISVCELTGTTLL